MGDLACNIVSYCPDQKILAANFRLWQVETLLDQAASLIDRCLDDFKDYSSLDYAWHSFKADLESQEKQFDLDRDREGGGGSDPDQDLITAQERESILEESKWSSESAKAELVTRPIDEDQAKEKMASPTAEASPFTSNLHIRAAALRRKIELSAPGRPFAINEQRDLVLKRLCRDYEEAVNRACVAEQGLKKIFDHVGSSSPLSFAAEPLNVSITNLAIWIRNSAEWLAAYQLREQSFTRVVSVRSLLNRNAWAQLKHARDSFSLKLQVPVDLFRGHDNCRLRGMSASLIGEAGAVPWSMIVRLPDEAIYERSGQSVHVDQSGLPSCLFGRVENRRAVRQPEICGAVSLINASPIGRSTAGGLWSLDIFKPVAATSESFGHLDDVVLEISAAGMPQRGNS